MRIIVLGGSGFIGANLIKLIGDFHDVLNFSRSNNLDLIDLDNSSKVFADFRPDAIVNVACHGGSVHYVTEFAADVISDNIAIALNLYKCIYGLPNKPKIINAIANCTYPGNTDIQKESDWLSGPVHDSVLPYAASKRLLYFLSKCYFEQYGVNSINLIFPNSFGPYDHLDPNKTHAINGIILRMMKAKKSGDKSFEIWGTGAPIREWIYVEDFCKILLSACYFNNIIEPVNIAQNKGYSIIQTVEIIKKLSGFKGDITFNYNYKDGDPIKILDDLKFKELFGDYDFIDHEEALSKTIKYYDSISLP